MCHRFFPSEPPVSMRSPRLPVNMRFRRPIQTIHLRHLLPRKNVFYTPFAKNAENNNNFMKGQS